jgi:hypothetical protein
METPENSNAAEVEAGWRSETEMLLQNWHRRVYAAQSAYYMEAERLRRWHFLLGIAVVILSTIVGSSAFTERGTGYGLPSLLIGGLGSLAAILAGLQTFLKLSESAAHHGIAADWYATIRREIEELQALPRHLRGPVRSTLDTIRQDMNKAGQTAPELGERRWAAVARRFGVDEPPLHVVKKAPRQGTPTGTTPAGSGCG